MDQLSFTTSPIKLYSSDNKLCGKASGFFYRSDEEYAYFITNWHVVSGRDPCKPNFMKHGYHVPVQAQLTLHSKQELHDQIRISDRIEYTIDINDAEGNNPRWFEHPEHRQKVDVVVLKLLKKELVKHATFATIYDCDLSPQYQEKVMDDVFVIGYPWGLHGGNDALPLYRRGTIAAEPIIDQQGLPRFLIDCRTSASMSGAPVICSHSGVWKPKGKLDENTIFGTVNKFVGVYSGRLYSHEKQLSDSIQETDIGLVWKISTIDEIILEGKLARNFGDLSE